MGAHPDDRDSVTDMTFLMFTCKAGAAGVGDGTMAAKVLRFEWHLCAQVMSWLEFQLMGNPRLFLVLKIQTSEPDKTLGIKFYLFGLLLKGLLYSY